MTYKTIDNTQLDAMSFGTKQMGQHLHIKLRFKNDRAMKILEKLVRYRNDIRIATGLTHTYITAIVHQSSGLMYDLKRAKG